MSKEMISLTIPDLSGFAKSLRSEMDNPPAHLDMLGAIARAAGFRNYQHLRARLAEAPHPDPVDDKRVARARRFFDEKSFLTHWPAKTRTQELCLWGIWAQLPAETTWSEREISARIDTLCRFRDAAQIRRSMIEHGLVRRDRDGSAYRRVERKPTPEAAALIARLLRA